MESRLEFLRLELFVELLRLEFLVFITIGSNIILVGKLNKRVFYYSVELFLFDFA
jgi:hypothetical protein